MMNTSRWVRGRGKARARDLNPNRSQFNEISRGRIVKIWALGNGSMVYKGCHVLLTDGKRCSLGKEVRVDRRVGDTLLDRRSRKRDGHVCVPIGGEVMMYNFVIEIDEIEIVVFKNRVLN